MDPVRLACVRHAASVRPEPGSNSPSRSSDSNTRGWHCRSIRRAGPDRDRDQLAQFWLALRFSPKVLSVHVLTKVIEGSTRPIRRSHGRPHSPFWHPVFRCQEAPASRSEASTRNVAQRPEIPLVLPPAVSAVWGGRRTYRFSLSESTRGFETLVTPTRPGRPPPDGATPSPFGAG